MEVPAVAVLRARESFYAGSRFVAAGEEVDAKDPAVKGREHLFDADTVVEQATAAPGEKRTTTRRTRQAK